MQFCVSLNHRSARQPMAAVEDDEETQLRELQAHLAM